MSSDENKTSKLNWQAQLIQCRDGTQDQRNINAILELAAGVDVDASKKVPEEGVAKEEGGEPSAKKRRREVKNAVRGSGQYVYDEEGVRSVQVVCLCLEVRLHPKRGLQNNRINTISPHQVS